MTIVDRTLLMHRLYREAIDATIEGDPHEADRWVTAMTRAELAVLRTRLLTLRVLVDNRLEELDLRDAEYRQREQQYPGMDEPA